MRKRCVFSACMLVMLSLLACGKQEVSLEDLVSGYRTDAKKLLKELSLMEWDSRTEGLPSDQSFLYRKYSSIFTMDAIDSTRKLLDTMVEGDERKALNYFLLYQQAEFISGKTSTLEDVRKDIEAEIVCYIDGKPVPYRDVLGLLYRETNLRKRAEISAERYRIMRLLNHTVLQRELDLSHRLALDLGYPSYAGLSEEYRRVDLDRLVSLCDQFLEESDTTYLKLFDEFSDIPRDQFKRRDIFHLMSAAEFEAYFPKEKLMETMEDFLSGMGIELEDQANITINSDENPRKVPRAACFPIEVPDDIRLTIKPIGGRDDYESLFHEMGHAQHYAHTTTPYFEFQQLGPYAATETFAYLFEEVVSNPRWVDEYLGMPGNVKERYVKYSTFTKLYMLRRYFAKLEYEILMHRGAENPREEYRNIMSRAYGFALDENDAERYLLDVDPLLYSADYSLAYFLEAMLSERLEDRFGEEWWNSREAGDYLAGLWAHGNAFSAEEMAVAMGYKDGIDASILARKIANRLGRI